MDCETKSKQRGFALYQTVERHANNNNKHATEALLPNVDFDLEQHSSSVTVKLVSQLALCRYPL